MLGESPNVWKKVEFFRSRPNFSSFPLGQQPSHEKPPQPAHMKSLRLSEADYAAILARKGAKVPAKPVVERKESQLERRLVQQLNAAGFREKSDHAMMSYIREYYAIQGRDFRLDFAWPYEQVGVEVQGAVHRIKGRHRADIEKRALHLLAGWRVLEVGGAEIRDGRAIAWIKELLT